VSISALLRIWVPITSHSLTTDPRMAIPHRQETPVKELPTEESYTKGPSEGMSSKKGSSKEVEERVCAN
jgi:hypothetical protein